jgi:O-antigen ligase
VGSMPDGFFRVMWVTSLFGVFTFFLSLRPEFASRWRPAVVALFAAMLFVSYTRAFWLGVVLGLGFIALQRVPGLLARASVRTTRRGAFAAVVGAGLLLGALGLKGEAIGESLVRRFASTFDLTEDVSNAIRVDQFAALVEVWERQPLLGTGFGGYAPQYLRSTEAPYSYELVSVALLMKTGVVGVALVLSALAALAARAWLAARRTGREGWLANWLGMVVAFLLAIQTNPFLFNFVGFGLVLFLLLDIVRVESEAAPAQPPPAAG